MKFCSSLRSYAADTEKTSFRKSFTEILHNKNYWMLFGCFSCFLGGFNTIGTLINQVDMREFEI